MTFYGSMYRLFAGLVRRIYRVTVIGAENEPPEGGCIVCANHLSDHDVLILAASMKRQVHYFAKAELFKVPLLKQLITALGAFPVKRGAADVASIKKTISLLDEGRMIGFFPQGTRYAGVDPRETKPKHGIGMIAYRSRAQILPVAIETKRFKIRMFKKTTLKIGRPLSYEELGFVHGNTDEYTKASEYIFERIVELLDSENSGNENK